MKSGWLIVNHFLQTEKFTEHYEWLQKAAEQKGICLTVKTGADLMCEIAEGLLSGDKWPDFGLFWDKDVRLALSLENRGLRLFNSARAVALCDDKSLTCLALAGKIPMPRTIMAPMTYPAIGYGDLSFVKTAGEALGYPMVIKECFGSFGGQVYLANNLTEAQTIVDGLSGRPFLFQECITSSFGRDVRIEVVGGRVIAAMERFNTDGDFRANISAGGKMRPFTPTKKQAELATLACDVLGLDFAGVDFLFGADETPILCEVNSNAHFKNLYDCTGVNAAEAIMDHVARTVFAE